MKTNNFGIGEREIDENNVLREAFGEVPKEDFLGFKKYIDMLLLEN